MATLAERRQRYLVVEVDTSDGVERILRTLALNVNAHEARLAAAPFLDDPSRVLDPWRGGVMILDPRPGTRLYLLPLIDGVVARWDLLLDAHRRRAWREAAAEALTAMGQLNGAAPERLVEWLATGATDGEPPGGSSYVPAPHSPMTSAEWFGIERRAQLIARLLPIAGNLSRDDPVGLALYIASHLIEPPRSDPEGPH
jgi:hypothetical protein